MSELSPRAQEIVAAARELLEDAGPSGLSMRALADRLGIRAPSIYKHLPDKQALENAVISAGFDEFAAALEAAQAEATGSAPSPPRIVASPPSTRTCTG